MGEPLPRRGADYRILRACSGRYPDLADWNVLYGRWGGGDGPMLHRTSALRAFFSHFMVSIISL